MKKIFTSMALGASLFALTAPAMAQDNLLAEKSVYTLGAAKVWYYYEGDVKTDQTETFDTEALSLLTQVPANTTNVFLYPEKGNLSGIAANQEIGAQGFYIDLGSSMSIGTVTTTWEGAAADNYEIYLTDAVPTLDILDTEATYTATGLGQYVENTAILPDNSKGRYLVFQVTKATNWGWGVKIRSISALAPQDDVLTSFSVSPSIVAAGEETPVSLTIKNQLDLDIPAENVQISVSSNAVYADGNLSIQSGNSATFTAVYDGVTLTANVYVAMAPAAPKATDIMTPIYTNTVTEYNEFAEFTTDWNYGAQKLGEVVFADGEVAMQFADARCIFFNNTETTGSWNANIFPDEKGYTALCLDVFSGRDVECTIEFENVEGLDGVHTYPFELTGGEWTPIKVDIAGANKLGNLSIRFTEENIDDILLANIYFEGDIESAVGELVVGESDATVSVYNLQGVCIKSNVSTSDSMLNLPAGLYIVGGKKVIVK